MGSLFFRRWFSREPIDDDVVSVAGVVAGLKPPPRRGSR
jgi:hypothetical protein